MDVLRNFYINEGPQKFCEFFQAYFEFDHFYMDDFTIEIDQYAVTDIQIDAYNNFHCSFSGPLPLWCLTSFRFFIAILYESPNGSRHLSTLGLYVSYFLQFHNRMDLNYLLTMCLTDEENTEERTNPGFREWLISDAFIVGGNLRIYRPDWDYRFLVNEKQTKGRIQ